MPRGALPGERRGGRGKGTPNRRTAEQIRAIEESGLTPLQYMLSILRDEAQPQEIRLEAASRAAPYVHARLCAAVVDLDVAAKWRRVEDMTDEELMAIIAEGERGQSDDEDAGK